MKTLANIKTPEPVATTATPTTRTTNRKPRVNADGSRNGLTKLKQMVCQDPKLRDVLYDLTERMTCHEWIKKVNELFEVGLAGHRSAVTRFRLFVQTLHHLEDQESRRELIIQRYREQYPNETQEQLDQRAILFFKQEAFATGDRDGFIKMGRFSLSLRMQKAKENGQAVRTRLAELRAKLLELQIQKLEAESASKESSAPITAPADEVVDDVKIIGGTRFKVDPKHPTQENLPRPVLAAIRQSARPLYPLFPLFPTFLNPVSAAVSAVPRTHVRKLICSSPVTSSMRRFGSI